MIYWGNYYIFVTERIKIVFNIKIKYRKFKKKGNNSRFKKGLGFVALLCLSKKINRYSKAKVKAKAKKRGGKNDK